MGTFSIDECGNRLGRKMTRPSVVVVVACSLSCVVRMLFTMLHKIYDMTVGAAVLTTGVTAWGGPSPMFDLGLGRRRLHAQ